MCVFVFLILFVTRSQILLKWNLYLKKQQVGNCSCVLIARQTACIFNIYSHSYKLLINFTSTITYLVFQCVFQMHFYILFYFMKSPSVAICSGVNRVSNHTTD